MTNNDTPAERDAIEQVVADLTPAERYVLKSDRFDPNGWEPQNPRGKIVCDMIDKGLFTRADGRCGFERFKDSFIVPTPLCLAVRDHLKETQHGG